MLRTAQRKLITGIRSSCSRMLSTGQTGYPENEEMEETGVRRRPERGMNRVTLVGRAGKDPEHRGSDEHPCIVFPLATNLTYRKANGEYLTKTDWHRICVFRPGLRDAVASRILKGDRLFVEGCLSYAKYSDSENRNNTVASILADDIMILQRRQNSTANQQEDNEDF